MEYEFSAHYFNFRATATQMSDFQFIHLGGLAFEYVGDTSTSPAPPPTAMTLKHEESLRSPGAIFWGQGGAKKRIRSDEWNDLISHTLQCVWRDTLRFAAQYGSSMLHGV